MVKLPRSRPMRRAQHTAMDENGNVQLLRASEQRMQVRRIEKSPVGAEWRDQHTSKMPILFGPVTYLTDARTDVAHGCDRDPAQPSSRVRTVIAHVAMMRPVQRAFKADIAEHTVAC